MIQVFRVPGFLLVALIATVAITGCRKQEEQVAGAARAAVDAGHRAQADSAKREQQRAVLAQIPLPTKSMYVDVHDPSEWANPFLAVGADTITLRIFLTDANPSKMGEGTMLRPKAARRQELQIRPGNLAEAIASLPAGAWRYGRVVAVAEDPRAGRQDRPQMRRNMENTIKQLNDLGVVVEEWPGN